MLLAELDGTSQDGATGPGIAGGRKASRALTSHDAEGDAAPLVSP
ncbi:hypothetical protein RM704_31855 [Streptomyces sp. DSM 3412]|uniref:Transposase n=1 Tax=Streptomyces gottesmaniae TaxID=3075518 RepID=A0ABU2Z6E5_9ACTN|nr:hypothetical protein [Streptomyces sp. DSM 3412]MDT0571996.1 hypothetical protein [Streptomyces sp. DSM 3412]